MRFVGIGLLGLLLVVGIMLYAQSLQGPTIKAGLQAQDDAAQIAGVDRHTGMKVTESAVLDGVMNGSQLRGVKVTSIITGGQLDDYYGLIPGDLVTEIVGLSRLSDISNNDADLATAQVYEAYQRHQVLGVDRPGVGKIQLPRDRALLPAAPPVPAVATPGASPAAPTSPLPGNVPAPAGSASPATPAGQQGPGNPPPASPTDDRTELQKLKDSITQPR